MSVNWDTIAAIGTILAALVGISGIIINLYEKRKRLIVKLDLVPELCLIISNTSSRSVSLLKMICSFNEHIVYVEYFTGMKERVLAPASIDRIIIDLESIRKAAIKLEMSVVCRSLDELNITLYDNYGRKYLKKTNLMFERVLKNSE